MPFQEGNIVCFILPNDDTQIVVIKEIDGSRVRLGFEVRGIQIKPDEWCEMNELQKLRYEVIASS